MFASRDGSPTGVSEDYWTLIRDKLGLHEETGERRPFRQILAAIEQGGIDLYAATTRTADRERYALFSDPYVRYPVAIAGAADAGLFSGTASLEGRRVAVGREYSAYHLLKARSMPACVPTSSLVQRRRWRCLRTWSRPRWKRHPWRAPSQGAQSGAGACANWRRYWRQATPELPDRRSRRGKVPLLAGAVRTTLIGPDRRRAPSSHAPHSFPSSEAVRVTA